MTRKTAEPRDPSDPCERLRCLGLYGLIARWPEIATQPWIEQLLQIEEAERKQRSLDRRLRNAKIGAFKPIDLFDWAWPTKIDRQAIEELFSLTLLDDGANAILLGPNGVGKSMILKNLAQHALVRGHTVRFTTASDMLAELAAQDSATALARRLRRWALPRLLCIDEVGYLSYSSRYADLLFEVVTRRYDAGRSIVVTTNKSFNDWSEVFPHAACTVTLVDRLVHRSEIIEITGESYRLKEAKERSAAKAKQRKHKPSHTHPA
ncbi:MAG TPA: ATP-binding protein [Polyangiaceae bacterium]|nr:ATP-binding protein [Polyangiaceae bacterium]